MRRKTKAMRAETRDEGGTHTRGLLHGELWDIVFYSYLLQDIYSKGIGGLSSGGTTHDTMKTTPKSDRQGRMSNRGNM